jgi:hypothetical protein
MAALIRVFDTDELERHTVTKFGMDATVTLGGRPEYAVMARRQADVREPSRSHRRHQEKIGIFDRGQALWIRVNMESPYRNKAEKSIHPEQ